ncbi:hypothetical protein EVAR_51273_1 [Eumeta japonica]|uniref:Uncharacterized protein n=1 Tax=Eumeta variegata TaxID=151549 RepID=A0A4C1YAR8_EUMVA|nr:hypothetical protein EVAR_51273_1 [Eumeta japonica]
MLLIDTSVSEGIIGVLLTSWVGIEQHDAPPAKDYTRPRAPRARRSVATLLEVAPMHMQMKFMATPPQLKCMQLTCATDAPPIKCSGSGASDTVARQPSHCEARLNKEV